MNPELIPQPETVTLTRIILDGDTLSGGWRKMYRSLAKIKHFSYIPVDTLEQLREQLEIAKLQSAQILIILSGQQLYDSQQDLWLQHITNEGFRENVVVITGHESGLTEWNYLTNKYGVKLMHKDPTGFGKRFLSLLDEISQTPIKL